MKSLEEVELAFRMQDTPNFPGYCYPPEFRPLKMMDSRILAPILKKEAKTIRTYLSDYQNADKWNLKDAQKFVSMRINDPKFPSFHYLFLCGPQVVGIGSIEPYGSSYTDCQIVLAVFGSHQGKGWGRVIAQTLQQIAFQVWGFERIYWINDATNIASSRLAQAIGCKLEESYEDNFILGENGTGLWYRWVAERPSERLAPGILQGAPLEYWSDTRSAGMLEALISSRKKVGKMNDDEIKSSDRALNS
jgi:RimJ/RimL family protein N-acetyltransferase